jgi:hypothetical protein
MFGETIGIRVLIIYVAVTGGQPYRHPEGINAPIVVVDAAVEVTAYTFMFRQIILRRFSLI